MAGRTRQSRGIALIVVLTGLTILAAFSAEFSFRTRVDIRTATNLEKEVQAYFHARSSMEIVRLVVSSQKFVDMIAAQFPPAKALELWKFACKFAEIFNTSSVNLLGIELMSLKGADGIGVDRGGFSCEVTSEDARINLNAVQAQDRLNLFTKMYALLRGQVGGEPLASGANDRKAAELILNILDWVDADDDRTDIDSNGKFVQAGGAGENTSYSRYGYKARNAKMDSVEEVRLVEGMTDDLFCKFGKNFTVYNTDKINVNEADLFLIRSLICSNLLGDPVQACLAPLGPGGTAIDYALGLMEICREMKKGFFMPPFNNENDFMNFFGRLPQIQGMPPLGQLLAFDQNKLKPMITAGKSRVLRVTARGWVGESGHQIQAVLENGTATYLYWKESGFDTSTRK